MARVLLKLLGGFEVHSDMGQPIEVPGRKAQALLAFLALPPGVAHPRDKLAALLWPEIGAAQARANLRLNLFTLRRALAFAEPLRLDGDTVALDPEAVDVDAVTLEHALVAENPDAIAAALAGYRGDLLAGLRTQEASFEEWLLAERERLREHAMDGWTRLLVHQQAAGDAGAAAQTALRLLAMDPLQEPVHRALMRLYAGLGRRGDALRQYHVCVSALKGELGVDPEVETRELYQEVLRSRHAPAAVDGGLHHVLLVLPDERLEPLVNGLLLVGPIVLWRLDDRQDLREHARSHVVSRVLLRHRPQLGHCGRLVQRPPRGQRDDTGRRQSYRRDDRGRGGRPIPPPVARIEHHGGNGQDVAERSGEQLPALPGPHVHPVRHVEGDAAVTRRRGCAPRPGRVSAFVSAQTGGAGRRASGALRTVGPAPRRPGGSGRRISASKAPRGGRRGIDGRRTRMEMTKVPGDVRRSYATYVVRIAWDEIGEVKGVVVHVATGERFPFAGLDRLNTLIRERVSAAMTAGE